MKFKSAFCWISSLLLMAIFVAACGGGLHGPATSLTGGGGVAAGQQIDYDHVVHAIIVKRCGACHMPNGPLPNWQDYQTAYSHKDKIMQRAVVEKSMPPKAASTITDEERQIIGEWIQAGAPKDLGGGGDGPNPEPSSSPEPTPTAPPDFTPIKDMLTTCIGCHDHNGSSQTPQFPRIAGQQVNYLETTLKAFKAKLRKEAGGPDLMWSMVQDKDDATIDLLAEYFSAQPTAPNNKGDANLAAQGKEIFEHGVSDRGIPACMSCHGANGEGTGIAPRLAGQHIDYILKQISAFREGLRTEATMMPAFAKNITDDDAKAVANYLQGL